MLNLRIFEQFSILRKAVGDGPESVAPMSPAPRGDRGAQEPPARSLEPVEAGVPDAQPDYFRYQTRKFEQAMADDAAADRAIKLSKAETELAIQRARAEIELAIQRARAEREQAVQRATAENDQAIKLGWAQTKQRLALRAGITALSAAVLILIVVAGLPVTTAIALTIAGLLGCTAGFGLATIILRWRGRGTRSADDPPSGQAEGTEPFP